MQEKYKVNQNYVIEEDTQGNRKVRFKPLEPKEKHQLQWNNLY